MPEERTKSSAHPVEAELLFPADVPCTSANIPYKAVPVASHAFSTGREYDASILLRDDIKPSFVTPTFFGGRIDTNKDFPSMKLGYHIWVSWKAQTKPVLQLLAVPQAGYNGEVNENINRLVSIGLNLTFIPTVSDLQINRELVGDSRLDFNKPSPKSDGFSSQIMNQYSAMIVANARRGDADDL